MLENDTKRLNNETKSVQHRQKAQQKKIQENFDKIKLNKQLPYLVGNVVEILDAPKDDEEDGVSVSVPESQKKGKVLFSSSLGGFNPPSLFLCSFFFFFYTLFSFDLFRSPSLKPPLAKPSTSLFRDWWTSRQSNQEISLVSTKTAT